MTTWLILVGGAVLLVSFVTLVARRRNRPATSAPLDPLSRDALTIVDLLAPPEPHADLPTTALTDVGQRVDQLCLRAGRLAQQERDARTTEALDDLRQVAIRLGAALEAERTRRVQQPIEVQHAAHSRRRISERAAELDLVARELTARSYVR